MSVLPHFRFLKGLRHLFIQKYHTSTKERDAYGVYKEFGLGKSYNKLSKLNSKNENTKPETGTNQIFYGGCYIQGKNAENKGCSSAIRL